jgi:hypothetical protein
VPDPREEGCECQRCGRRYKLDVTVPDHIWEKIKPLGPPGSGLLCGQCIVWRVEDRITGFGMARLSIEDTSRCLGAPPLPRKIDMSAPDYKGQLSQAIQDGVDYQIALNDKVMMTGGVLSMGKYEGYCEGCPTCKPEKP